MINLSDGSNKNMEKVILQFCYKKNTSLEITYAKIDKTVAKKFIKNLPILHEYAMLMAVGGGSCRDMVRDVFKIKIVDKKSVEYDENDITSASKNLIQCTYDNEENDSENDPTYPGDSFESLMMYSIMQTLHQIIQTGIIVRYKNRIITRIRFYCNNTKIFDGIIPEFTHSHFYPEEEDDCPWFEPESRFDIDLIGVLNSLIKILKYARKNKSSSNKLILSGTGENNQLSLIERAKTSKGKSKKKKLIN